MRCNEQWMSTVFASSAIHNNVTLVSLQSPHLLCSECFSSTTLAIHHIVSWITTGLFLSTNESLRFLEDLHEARIVNTLMDSTAYFVSLFNNNFNNNKQLLNKKLSSNTSTVQFSILSAKCQSNLLSILKELLLSSSKFMNQVSFYFILFVLCSKF